MKKSAAELEQLEVLQQVKPAPRKAPKTPPKIRKTRLPVERPFGTSLGPLLAAALNRKQTP